MNEKALEKVLNIFLKEILPLTEQGVAKGSKIFGAAIIKKDDLSQLQTQTMKLKIHCGMEKYILLKDFMN